MSGVSVPGAKSGPCAYPRVARRAERPTDLAFVVEPPWFGDVVHDVRAKSRLVYLAGILVAGSADDAVSYAIARRAQAPQQLHAREYDTVGRQLGAVCEA